MIKRDKIVFIVSLFLCCTTYSRGETNVNPIALLKLDDFNKRRHAIEVLNRQRQEVVENMISVLDGKFTAETKDDAAKLLGDYRASEAVNVLAQQIELDTRARIIKGLLSEEAIQPISTALVRLLP